MDRSAGIYVRISSDPTGARLGVKRQLQDCKKKADSLGWAVCGIYEDNDVSASTTKPRPEYQRMLADLEAGEINAVIVWDLDRLTRRPIEIEQFIDLADRMNVALASVGGDVDLATDNGRMFARIKGAVARAEVERKGARQARANQQRAENGLPPGGKRLFGYEPRGMEIRESEAAEIRQAAEELLNGGTVHGVARGFRQRDVRTTSGGRWNPTEVRRMLMNPRLAAIRRYKGETVCDGVWPAILDRDTHLALRAFLDDPSRKAAGPPRRYLLSGVATCAVCGARVFGATDPKGPKYRCESRAHISRNAEPIEEFINDVVVARLSRPDARELFTPADDRSQVQQLQQEEASIRARLDGLAEAFGAGDIDRQQLRAGTDRLRAKLETVTKSLGAVVSSPRLAKLITSTDVAATWQGLEVATRREIIRTLMDVVLSKPGQGVRRFDPATVRINWKT